LVVDEEFYSVVDKVKEYAEKNRLNHSKMHLMMKGVLRPPGYNPDYVCHINFGYRVCYTLEEHPCGWCRHISISVDKKDRTPNPAAVLTIMKAFGFTQESFKECKKVWLEDVNPAAVNVLALENP